MDRQNHMPATPENLPLFPKMPPMFLGPEFAAMPPGEVTPMVLMMMMIMLGRYCLWVSSCLHDGKGVAREGEVNQQG